MASYFNLSLDTTAPSGVSLKINNGATFTTTNTVTLAISCGDSNTSGYQMKIWGGVSGATTESAASWGSFATSKSVELSAGDGLKTINLKVRDTVGNESAAVTATITLDTTAAAVTVTGPDMSTISKINGHNSAAFTFTADTDFTEYMVRVVPATSSAYTAGTQIGTANGSTNMGATGSFKANTAISCTINGADLEAASSGDGVKIIKVFVKDTAGNWSDA